MTKVCRECGDDLSGMRKGAVFCCAECRKVWNNRRMVRGAEIYDLLMANRYEREWASEQNMLTIISNMARAYRDSDKRLRAGRKSWDARETLARLPIGFGSEGDKR